MHLFGIPYTVGAAVFCILGFGWTRRGRRSSIPAYKAPDSTRVTWNLFQQIFTGAAATRAPARLTPFLPGQAFFLNKEVSRFIATRYMKVFFTEAKTDAMFRIKWKREKSSQLPKNMFPVHHSRTGELGRLGGSLTAVCPACCSH